MAGLRDEGEASQTRSPVAPRPIRSNRGRGRQVNSRFRVRFPHTKRSN